MNKLLRSGLIFFLLFLFYVSLNDVSGIKRKIAPDFNLFDLDGKVHRLSKVKCKLTILNFFASWCVPCQEEVPGLVRLYKKFKSCDVEFFGIALMKNSSRPKIKKFIDENMICYPVVLSTREVIKKYNGIKGIPTTLILNNNSEIVFKHIGYFNEKDLERIIINCLGDNHGK